MPITTSLSKNTVKVALAIEGSNGAPISPDDEIVFTVYGEDQETVRFTDAQDLGDELGTGEFEFYFTPVIEETCFIEAVWTIDGRGYAERVPHAVLWVLG